MFSRLHRELPSWRRALRRRRRTLALLAGALAVVALLPALLPASVQGTPTLVAQHDLPTGTVLAPEHVSTVHLAAELLPPGAPTDAEELLGRRVARSLPAGTPLLPALLHGPEAAAIPSGQVLMAVPVPEVLLPHLSPGTAIDLLPTAPLPTGSAAGSEPLPGVPPGGTAVIPARVVSVPAAPTDSGGPAAPAATMPEILVTVDAARSRDAAHALVSGGVVIAVIGYSPSGPALAAPPPHDS